MSWKTIWFVECIPSIFICLSISSCLFSRRGRESDSTPVLTQKMLPAALWLLCLTALSASARTTKHSTTNDFYSTTFSTLTTFTTTDFAGSKYTYVSAHGQSTVGSENATQTASSSGGQVTRHTTSHKLTLIGGSPTNSTNNGSASATTSSAAASNTVPCNNYPQFCNRKYSNITEVCSHNSAFTIRNNAGSNQFYGITDQLNDGVRMLQGETPLGQQDDHELPHYVQSS